MFEVYFTLQRGSTKNKCARWYWLSWTNIFPIWVLYDLEPFIFVTDLFLMCVASVLSLLTNHWTHRNLQHCSNVKQAFKVLVIVEKRGSTHLSTCSVRVNVSCMSFKFTEHFVQWVQTQVFLFQVADEHEHANKISMMVLFSFLMWYSTNPTQIKMRIGVVWNSLQLKLLHLFEERRWFLWKWPCTEAHTHRFTSLQQGHQESAIFQWITKANCP